MSEEELKTPEQLRQESYQAAYDEVKAHWIAKIQPKLSKPDMGWVYLSKPFCVSEEHMATFAKENGFEVRVQFDSGPTGNFYEVRVPNPLLDDPDDD